VRHEKRPACCGPFCFQSDVCAADQAAFNHIEVSKALLIIGMLVPKFGLVPALALALVAGLVASGAVSAARSHDPFSWERATEKNKNI
jgi:hypothetical protein